uniref:U3 small nucleolar RNA-associated protein 15 homolog n=1 Tax=Ascaris suum TaxID=6253 RepID=F1L276_ASCSU
MAQPYRRLPRLRSGKFEKQLSEDVVYWKRMKQLAIFQEPGNMTSTSFAPVEPYYVASTSSVRLSIFDTLICEPISMYTRFKEAVFGAIFRHDGRLLAVGGHEGKVRLFDVQKQGSAGSAPKTPLRVYKAHSSPVHMVLFSCSGKRIITMADDGSVKIFDISETKSIPLRVIEEAHKDRIRCGIASKISEHIFVSGSYDHQAKVWDTREEGNEPLVCIDHDAPIEAVVLLRGDAVLATAGGTTIKLWDIASGGRLLCTLQNHHKSVTCMCLATNGTRLLSGGLDKKINIFRTDGACYAVVHSLSVPAPVYTLAISGDDQCMAVGMGNLLAIFRRDVSGKHEQTLREAKAVGAGLEYSMKIPMAPPAPEQRQRGGLKYEVDITAPLAPKLHLGRIDILLRQYKHWKAVDVLFRNRHYWENSPDLVVAAFMEIYGRKALPFSLAGRDAETIRPILVFLSRYLFRSNYFATLSIVASTLFEVYAEEQVDPSLVKYFQKLNDAVARELSLQKTLRQAIGAMEVLFASSRTERKNKNIEDNEFFGDVIILPITLSMKEQRSDDSREEEKQMDIDREKS